MYEPSSSVRTLLRPLSHRPDSQGGAADRLLHRTLRILRLAQYHWFRKRRFEHDFCVQLDAIESLTRDQLADEMAVLRTAAARGSETYSAVMRALAVVCNAVFRHLERRVSLEQTVAAWSCLLGAVVILENEEDRTWALALAAATGGLLGFPVQVMHATTLRSREFHEEFAFLFANLNLRLGIVSDSLHKAERSMQYSTHVVLSTARQTANDYLLDQLLHGGGRSLLRRRLELLLRPSSTAPRLISGQAGLVLVDQADQQLVDNGMLPVTVSGGDGHFWTGQVLRTALMLCDQLEQGEDFCVDAVHQEIELTDNGRERLQNACSDLPKIWRAKLLREETVVHALVVKTLLLRGVDYEVERSGIALLRDAQQSGRPTLTRERLQLLKLKESIGESIDAEVLAKISIPQFFSRYALLGGVCANATSVEKPLWEGYGVLVVSSMSKHSRIMKECELCACPTDQDRLRAIIARVDKLLDEDLNILLPVRGREVYRQLLESFGSRLQPLTVSQKNSRMHLFATQAGVGRVLLLPEPELSGLKPIVLAGVFEDINPTRILVSEAPETRRHLARMVRALSHQSSSARTELYLSLEDFPLTNPFSKYLLGKLEKLLLTRPDVARYIVRVLLCYTLTQKETQVKQAFEDAARADDGVQRLLAFAGRRSQSPL